MKLKQRQFGFQIKAVEDDGSFSGYGSVFNVADAMRDVVLPGAFQKSLAQWKQKNALPPILWQHRPDQPIGPYTKMSEDGQGLYVEGQLLIKDVKKAREAHALLKSGAIRGMSIGYNPIVENYNGQTHVNELSELELWECSIVTFPANAEATVTQIKSMLAAGRVPSISEFEELLRDAAGFSRKQATAIASVGYAKFLTQRDADRGDGSELIALDSVLASIKSFTR